MKDKEMEKIRYLTECFVECLEPIISTAFNAIEQHREPIDKTPRCPICGKKMDLKCMCGNYYFDCPAKAEEHGFTTTEAETKQEAIKLANDMIDKLTKGSL